MSNLSAILQDTNYKLNQFSDLQIKKLEERIFIKKVRGKEQPFVNCLVRDL